MKGSLHFHFSLHALEKEMAAHSSILAWRIPGMEEPGGLLSMGSHRVGHDWATVLSLSWFGEGNGNPLQCSCLENPRDGRAWWAAVYGVAQSRTRLKWLSSSSSSKLLHMIPSNDPPKTLTVAISSSVSRSVLSESETPCTVALQAPLSMGFFKQEYWSGVPSPSPKAV